MMVTVSVTIPCSQSSCHWHCLHQVAVLVKVVQQQLPHNRRSVLC